MAPPKNSEPTYEERLQGAIRAIKSGEEPNVPAASEAFDVKRRTLYRRLAGTTVDRATAHEEQQRLTLPEEKAIVKWCFTQDDLGFPPRLDMVKDMAIKLESKRTGKTPLALGKNWISRFLKRHPDLALKLSTRLERQRAYANDPEVLRDYFAKLGRIIREHRLQDFQIYNMDEKGFVMGLASRAKVLCRRGRRNPRVTHDGKRELVTVIETVGGDGAVVSPFVINKGAGHYMGWYKNLTEKERMYQFSYSPKGWTDNQLALQWLQKIFLPESQQRCGDLPRLLIFDGHGSHITFEFVSLCFANNVLLLCLPPHSTHLLQPLDVGLFGPYQHFYGVAVDNYIRSGQNVIGIKKSIFIPFLTEARQATFTPHNIRQSFAATGISPLNPRRVLGKLNPKVDKRRDTLGIIKKPSGSREIRHQVLAAGNLLGNLNLKNLDSTLDRVKGIMSSLGHQLEEEIASKEVWREMSLKLQSSDKLYNATDRRKLSEAKVLDGAALMELRDARLVKDEKKQNRLASRKGVGNTPIRVRKGYLKTKKQPAITPSTIATPIPRERRMNIITLAQTPHVLVIDSQEVSSDESAPEDISDSEWSSAIILGPPPLPFAHRPLSPSHQLIPPSTLRMSLRTRKSTFD